LEGASRGGRKIFQPKSKGGLGVRDAKVVNMSLLAKWKWRLLQDELPLWKVVLREKFGDSVSGLMPVEGLDGQGSHRDDGRI